MNNNVTNVSSLHRLTWQKCKISNWLPPIILNIFNRLKIIKTNIFVKLIGETRVLVLEIHKNAHTQKVNNKLLSFTKNLAFNSHTYMSYQEQRYQEYMHLIICLIWYHFLQFALNTRRDSNLNFILFFQLIKTFNCSF